MLGVVSFSLLYLFGVPQTVEKALVYGPPKGAIRNTLLSQILHMLNAPNAVNCLLKASKSVPTVFNLDVVLLSRGKLGQ